MTKFKFFQDFKNDNRGILLEGLIAITFIMVTSIVGLVGALAVNRIADAMTPFAGSNINALVIIQNCRNAYIVSVVLGDILLLVYWGTSAQRKERQESPSPIFFGG